MVQKRKLTGKMMSFIDAYFGEANFNARKAYDLSAYESKSTSSTTINKIVAELMLNPLIIAEIKRRQEIRQERSEVTAEYLVQKLLEIIETEQQENPQAALRAIELAGKSIALWKERQEISGPDGEAIKHEQHIKESAADFTNKLQSLASRNPGANDPSGTSNVVGFPDRRAEGGA